jgi:hypothetical protein
VVGLTLSIEELFVNTDLELTTGVIGGIAETAL